MKAPISCKLHPQYEVKLPPKDGCQTCWRIWLSRRSPSCDHKFIDSKTCLKCGWKP